MYSFLASFLFKQLGIYVFIIYNYYYIVMTSNKFW